MSRNVFNTLHVNFWGNPGSGKTELAGDLLARLSKAGYAVDLVPNYHRELQLTGMLSRKDERTGKVVEIEQMLITSEQYRREALFDTRVQVLITDAPIMQGMVFAPPNYKAELTKIMSELTVGWDSINVLLNNEVRENYQSSGRIQSAKESLALRPEIEAILLEHYPAYVSMSENEAIERVFDHVVHQMEALAIYEPSN